MIPDRWDHANVTLAEARPGAATLMRALPALDSPRVDVTYEQMRARLSRRHWWTAAGAAAGFFTVNFLAHLSPVSHATPATLVARALGTSGLSPARAASVAASCGALLTLVGLQRAAQTRPRKRLRGWWRISSLLRTTFDLALHEERVWREGSDRWRLRTRVTACLIIGVLQLLAVILPLTFALTIAALSGLFSYWYRRAAGRDKATAMVDTVALHWAYYVTTAAATPVVALAVLAGAILGGGD